MKLLLDLGFTHWQVFLIRFLIFIAFLQMLHLGYELDCWRARRRPRKKP